MEMNEFFGYDEMTRFVGRDKELSSLQFLIEQACAPLKDVTLGDIVVAQRGGGEALISTDVIWEPCLADHRYISMNLIPSFTKRLMLQDNSTHFIRGMELLDAFEEFPNHIFIVFVDYFYDYSPLLFHHSFASLLNLVPFPMYCCQQDLQRSRRDVGELTVQEEPRKSEMRQRASKASIGDVRLLHYSLRSQNVGRLCIGIVGCLDRQERSAGYSTSFSLIPRIEKDHRKRRRKLRCICQT